MSKLKHLLINRRYSIVSYCTSNELVLESIMEEAKAKNTCLLIEATANQVNQYGGYTGMSAKDFQKFIEKLIEYTGFDERKLILGGDHLGPLLWTNESKDIAMKKAEALVISYVEAGFTKIHLDTSMKLVGDSVEYPLSIEIIAQRGAKLAKAAYKAWLRIRANNPDLQELVFVIGSEVPTPGGSLEEEKMKITSVDDFNNTVSTYKRVFLQYGIEELWNNIIAVVVHPGVEFTDNVVYHYDRLAAKSLTKNLINYPKIVLEGHSTDYQTLEDLISMTQDGIRILKVGPELTFSLREALFSLALLENELIPKEARSNFRAILDKEMCKSPKYWEKYYHGSSHNKAQARAYSFLDRSRYYLTNKTVEEAINKLFFNLDGINIPPNIFHQFIPNISQIENGNKINSRTIVKRIIQQGVVKKYQSAVAGIYI